MGNIVCRWFAERCDLILLLFDCSKLDISDEFKGVIEELQPHEDKIHCVLNKADQLDTEALMRVYGALLWNMGRIFRGAEVTRIYVGSFHDEPLLREEHRPLFGRDEHALHQHLVSLPKACSMRKINEMVKRLRFIVVHICLLGYIRAKLPFLYGRERMQLYLLEHLDEVFHEVQLRYSLAKGDFPKLEEYKAALSLQDFATFPALDRTALNAIQDLLIKDIPRISSLVAHVTPNRLDYHGDSEGEEEDRRVPQMFKYSENEGNPGGGLTASTVILVLCGVLALVLAVLVASWSDEEKAQVKEIVIELLRRLQEAVKFG